jgi:hypothetical protein
MTHSVVWFEDATMTMIQAAQQRFIELAYEMWYQWKYCLDKGKAPLR